MKNKKLNTAIIYIRGKLANFKPYEAKTRVVVTNPLLAMTLVVLLGILLSIKQ
jgi:hypothetical protein